VQLLSHNITQSDTHIMQSNTDNTPQKGGGGEDVAARPTTKREQANSKEQFDRVQLLSHNITQSDTHIMQSNTDNTPHKGGGGEDVAARPTTKSEQASWREQFDRVSLSHNIMRSDNTPHKGGGGEDLAARPTTKSEQSS